MTTTADRRLTHALLVVFTLLAVAPLAGILFAALHRPGDVLSGFALPTGLELDGFRHAWETGGFDRYLRSSAIVTAAVVAGASFVSVLAGYAFGTMRFRGDNVIFSALLLGLIVPFEAMIIPLYYDMREVGLTETYWALILPQVGLALSFGTFWMRAFFLAAPRELIEAARVDGASSWAILWRVLVPIGRPAITTMMLLIALTTWNEFLLALVMVDSSEALRTAPLGLANFQSRYGTDVIGLAAGSVIVATPVVVVYLFLQRHFVRGMLAGAIKG
jgi:raffinose/stachyose/melibiose transport system permease protein